MPDSNVVDEVSFAVSQAAGNKKVLKIRLEVGKKVTVSKAAIASELHKRFKQASIEIDDCSKSDSVVVKDIEVE